MFYYQTSSIIVYILFPLLALLVVGLRFSARRITRLPLGADDWVVLMALIINIGSSVYAVVSIYTTDYEDLIYKMKPYQYRESAYVDSILIIAIIGPVKCSVVLFYKRIFKTRNFRIVANVVLAICASWTIAAILTESFHSYPITDYFAFDSSIMNWGLMELIMNVLDLFLDLLILSLPLPMIRKLHISTRKRLAVGAIFGLGLFCVVAVSVRLAYFVQLSIIVNDPTFLFKNIVQESVIDDASLLWAHIECSASIMTACLPTLVPVFARFKTVTSSLGSWTRLIRKTSKESADDISSDHNALERPKNNEKDSSLQQESETESRHGRVEATTVISVS